MHVGSCVTHSPFHFARRVEKLTAIEQGEELRSRRRVSIRYLSMGTCAGDY